MYALHAGITIKIAKGRKAKSWMVFMMTALYLESKSMSSFNVSMYNEVIQMALEPCGGGKWTDANVNAQLIFTCSNKLHLKLVCIYVYSA